MRDLFLALANRVLRWPVRPVYGRLWPDGGPAGRTPRVPFRVEQLLAV
jgi:hypothetical protein